MPHSKGALFEGVLCVLLSVADPDTLLQQKLLRVPNHCFLHGLLQIGTLSSHLLDGYSMSK